MVGKSAQAAIDAFVEAITQYYLDVKGGSDDVDSVTDQEEFVSSIEQDLRATLRDRLSKVDTFKEAQETETIELSSASLAPKAGHNGEPTSNMELTMDTNLDVHAVQPQHEHRSPESPTLDSAASSNVVAGNATRLGQTIAAAEISFDDAEAIARKAKRAGQSAPSTPQPPNGYNMISTLGRGGMGIVYKALHVPLNRIVAIKMIISGQFASEDQLSRFQREAEASARLSHPHIVQVYEVGKHKGLPYFSLEFVDGPSLADMMKETTLTAREGAALLLPVARAIQYSHEMGVLHRDLKPQNILLTRDGVPKVADFGLAKRLDDDNDDEKTRVGMILGTPGYMAPEQARNTDAVGPQSDVYALGCILYYLLTGKPPFNAPTPFETVRQLLQNEPVAPSRLQMGLDRDLETICLKTLEKDLDKRYASAGELADELQRFLDGEPIHARPITRRERAWKWCKRNPRVATLSGLAASLLLCLLVGGIVSSIVINHQKNAEQIARAEAEENAKLADDQSELALDTTRLILYEAKTFFDGRPELRQLRAKMLQSILSGVEQLHTERYQNDPRETFVASADAQFGQIYLEAGAYDKAEDKLLSAQRKLRELNKDGKLFNADVSQMNLTLALGDTYRGLGQLEKAEAEYVSAQRQRTDYFDKHPQFSEQVRRQSMAEIDGKLASVYSLMGKPDQAIEYALRSTEARRNQLAENPNRLASMMELAGALSVLSTVYEKAGDTTEMLDVSSELLGLQQEIAKHNTDVPTLHNNAKDQKVVARQYLLLDRPQEAKQLLHNATTTLDEIRTLSDDQRIHNQTIDAYYWQGVTLDRLGEDSSTSYQNAEELQRIAIKKSDNVNNQGMLLKILARAGKVDEAIKLADAMAAKPNDMMSCGYAGCGYALITEHLEDDPDQHAELTEKAIAMIRRLIRHGFRDFESLRRTDLDFEPLQQNPTFLKMLDEETKLAVK